MNSMIYKRKSPLLIFLIPAFLFLLVFLYYPFVQNIINTFLKIGGLGRAAEGVNEPWYENYARKHGCPYLRMDTNERNRTARALYAKLGYTEPGIVDCRFNGIPGVQLVCLEKKVN